MLHAATDTPDRTVTYKKVAELELRKNEEVLMSKIAQ
jgi:hypothetical protein